MPVFRKSTFRTSKKPPKRRTTSLPNISSLDETTYSLDDLKLEGGPVVLRLGGQEMVFEGGRWTTMSVADGHLAEDAPPKELGRLQRQILSVTEENNLLRYKVELLLDMLAASNADFESLQKELQAYKRSPSQSQRQ